MICPLCGDLVREVDWQQLSLDDSHVVAYRGEHCLCEYRIVDAVVILMLPAGTA